MNRVVSGLLSLVFLMTALVIGAPASANLMDAWVARYNGPAKHLDVPTAIAVDGRDNVYVTGYSLGTASGYDYATVAYDVEGRERWVARYNGPGNGLDMATAIAVDNRGNVYVTGYSYGSSRGLEYYDYATIKYDARGRQQWVVQYNGPGDGLDIATAIAVDDRGNVYVTGYTRDQDTEYDDCDFTTVKYDAAGREQWVTFYNSPGNARDVPKAIVVDEYGNIFVTGYSCRTAAGAPSCDYGTVTYDHEGIEQDYMAETEPPDWDDITHTTVMDRHGNVYMTSPSVDNEAAGRDYATAKEGQDRVLTGAVMALLSRTKNMQLPARTQFRLMGMLEGAIKSLGRGRTVPATNRLDAFIRTVETERDRSLTSEHADDLIGAAGEIMDALGEKEKRNPRSFRTQQRFR